MWPLGTSHVFHRPSFFYIYDKAQIVLFFKEKGGEKSISIYIYVSSQGPIGKRFATDGVPFFFSLKPKSRVLIMHKRIDIFF